MASNELEIVASASSWHHRYSAPIITQTLEGLFVISFIISQGSSTVKEQPGANHGADVFFVNQTGVSGPGWPTLFESGDSGTWNGPKALGDEF